MTIHAVTFSDASMSRARSLCANSAYEQGVDRTWPWSKESVKKYTVARDYPSLFRQPEDTRRAWAWWAWKPAIIVHQMQQMLDNDICIYADAGIEFIAPVNEIINRMDGDVWLFGNLWQHSHWCKGDAMRAVFPDGQWEDFDKQVQASVIFFKVTDFSRAIVREWLDLCLMPGLIDDSLSKTLNHEQFQEHRHDQSLLTCLAYKYKISLHWWPAVYNRFFPELPTFVYEQGEYQDDYPPLFHHHRLRNDQWPTP